jgi:hypothetical protein
MSESNTMTYVNNSFTFFKSSYYVQYIYFLSPIFHLDCTRFTFLTHFGNKINAIKGETTSAA